MYETIGRAQGTDYFRIADQLTREELDYLQRTRAFVDDEVLPVINGYWERAEFPRPLIEKMAGLGIVGDGIVGYGCPPMSPIASGLIHLELNRGDGSLGTFLGVQAGLAMQSIAMLGSEEQKQRWLPPMAALEAIGAFALTEPTHGSDSVALETSARRDGDTWVLNGTKKWIGNGSIADVVVVWARDEADRRVKGFLRGEGHAGLRRAQDRGQGLVARGVAGRDHADRRTRPRGEPAARRAAASRTPAGCSPAPATPSPGGRSGTPRPRTRSRRSTAPSGTQFGKPLVSFQIVQDKLVKMLAEVCSMQLYCLRLGRLIEEGRLTDTIAAHREDEQHPQGPRGHRRGARDLLGGNGILLDFHVMRHMADIEALHTYEGTETIQTLIVGRDITGVGAFA